MFHTLHSKYLECAVKFWLRDKSAWATHCDTGSQFHLMMKYMIEMITISLQTQHGIIKQDNAQNDIPAIYHN